MTDPIIDLKQDLTILIYKINANLKTYISTDLFAADKVLKAPFFYYHTGDVVVKCKPVDWSVSSNPYKDMVNAMTDLALKTKGRIDE